jgi:hypothetical protein
MSDAPPITSFDDLLAVLKPAGTPVPYQVKAWGGRTVYLRTPSSADADRWRFHVQAHKDGSKPLIAKLLQILLCDANGNHIIPDDESALDDLASSHPAAIDEIGAVALPMINDPTAEEVEEEGKG